MYVVNRASENPQYQHALMQSSMSGCLRRHVQATHAPATCERRALDSVAAFSEAMKCDGVKWLRQKRKHIRQQSEIGGRLHRLLYSIKHYCASEGAGLAEFIASGVTERSGVGSNWTFRNRKLAAGRLHTPTLRPSILTATKQSSVLQFDSSPHLRPYNLLCFNNFSNSSGATGLE